MDDYKKYVIYHALIQIYGTEYIFNCRRVKDNLVQKKMDINNHLITDDYKKIHDMTCHALLHRYGTEYT